MQQLLLRRRRWLGTLAASAVMLGLLAPTAAADNVGNPSYQHTSLYNYYSTDQGCVSIGETTEHTNYPTDTWASAVGSSLTGGSTLSWTASIAGWVGISYTPASYCNDAYVLNSGDLIVIGALYFWNGRAWTLCETNPGWPGWTRSTSVTWGWRVLGNAVCGAGWYYSAGTGQAFQDDGWRGAEPYLTDAGPSGPIWMD